MVRINWTLLAVEDLRDIKNYISKDSKYYAAIQIKKIKFRTKSLKSNPQIGRVVPETQIESIRELIEGNYHIIYKVLNEFDIDILTIYHSARNLSASSG
jgi:plasmid stabilization system protein ParE